MGLRPPRTMTVDPDYEAFLAEEAYDAAIEIVGNAALIGIRHGQWDLYAAAFQRLQVEAMAAITATHTAGGAR